MLILFRYMFCCSVKKKKKKSIFFEMEFAVYSWPLSPARLPVTFGSKRWLAFLTTSICKNFTSPPPVLERLVSFSQACSSQLFNSLKGSFVCERFNDLFISSSHTFICAVGERHHCLDLLTRASCLQFDYWDK